jgi:hypothetical protein
MLAGYPRPRQIFNYLLAERLSADRGLFRTSRSRGEFAIRSASRSNASRLALVIESPIIVAPPPQAPPASPSDVLDPEAAVARRVPLVPLIVTPNEMSVLALQVPENKP